MLLAAGVDVNSAESSWTALMFAARNNFPEIVEVELLVLLGLKHSGWMSRVKYCLTGNEMFLSLVLDHTDSSSPWSKYECCERAWSDSSIYGRRRGA